MSFGGRRPAWTFDVDPSTIPDADALGWRIFSTGEGFDDWDWAFALVVRCGGRCGRSCCRGRRGRGRTGERKLFQCSAVRSAQGGAVRARPRGRPQGAVESGRRAGREPRLSAHLRRRPARGCVAQGVRRKPQKPGSVRVRHASGLHQAAWPRAPGAWTALGPVTPERPGRGVAVLRPGHADRARPRRSPGRVTAIAIDPAAQASAPAGALPAVGRRRGRRHLAHERRARRQPQLDRAAGRPADERVRLADLRSRRRPATRSTRAPASPTAPATPRPGSACSSRPTAARLVAGSRQRGRGDQPLDRRDRRRPDRPGHDLHRHGARAPRLLVGQRRPAHAAGRADAGRLPSTDGGAHFTLEADLADKTPADPTPPAPTGVDFFPGGISKLELDPNDPTTLYAAVFGYGLWRSTDGGGDLGAGLPHDEPERLRSDGSSATRPATRRVRLRQPRRDGKTRIYARRLRPTTSRRSPQVWRTDDAAAIAGDRDRRPTANAGWTELSSSTNGRPASGVQLLPERPVQLRQLRPARPSPARARHATVCGSAAR